MPLNRKVYGVLVVCAGLCFASCSNTKYIPEGDALYIGARIQIDSSKMSHKQKKRMENNLLSLTRPKTNSKILGLRIKLLAYNLAGKPKKEKSPRGWLKNKFGEPPVLASELDLDRNSKILQSYLQNKGYFEAMVEGDTVITHKKARAIYHVQPGEVYTIQQVNLLKDSTSVNRTISADFTETFLK
jgi:outer membrane protein insertion porin family